MQIVETFINKLGQVTRTHKHSPDKNLENFAAMSPELGPRKSTIEKVEGLMAEMGLRI